MSYLKEGKVPFSYSYSFLFCLEGVDGGAFV
jgi:hypothetical protein